MTKLTKLIVDCATGESKQVPLSDEEIAELEAQSELAALERQQAEAAATALAALKASAKAKLIAGEPMTEEEASVLIG